MKTQMHFNERGLVCRPIQHHQPKGEGTGTAIASDLLMLPIPQIMQPGVDKAENLAPQRSHTSYPIVDRRLSVAAQK